MFWVFLSSHFLSTERLKYENYIFVSYVCETRSLTVTAEHTCRMFEIIMLTRISRPKWDVVRQS
jgi:hypothetical protein